MTKLVFEEANIGQAMSLLERKDVSLTHYFNYKIEA